MTQVQMSNLHPTDNERAIYRNPKSHTNDHLQMVIYMFEDSITKLKIKIPPFTFNE